MMLVSKRRNISDLTNGVDGKWKSKSLRERIEDAELELKDIEEHLADEVITIASDIFHSLTLAHTHSIINH